MTLAQMRFLGSGARFTLFTQLRETHTNDLRTRELSGVVTEPLPNDLPPKYEDLEQPPKYEEHVQEQQQAGHQAGQQPQQ